MKIGILTYHCAHNYGAVLQAYALLYFLKNSGHDVHIINYKPKYLRYGLWVWYNWFSLKPIKLIKKMSFQMSTFSTQSQRASKFSNFIRSYLSPTAFDLNTLSHYFDLFIIGSDQIWRKNGGKFDDIYWGKFPAAKSSLLIAYGASLGMKKLSVNDEIYITKALTHFRAVGVRENSLKDLLSPLSDKTIELVLDPTFLLESKDWNKIAKIPSIKRPYVLIYQVISIPAIRILAEQVAKELNADIIEITSTVNAINKQNVIQAASPEEFVGWIREASCVITTSFHGTAFSLIYGKPFMCLKRHQDSDLRMESLLSETGQLHRFIDCKTLSWEKDILETPTVDYNLLLEKSKFFLTSSIYGSRNFCN